MTIEILTLLFVFLAASFNFLLVAEKFIEWRGLVPPPAGQDDDKTKIIKKRIANDDGGIFEADIESIALREDFRRKWLD